MCKFGNYEYLVTVAVFSGAIDLSMGDEYL